MSFGFSVGDFFAVGGLIVKIVEILRDTSSEYQELIRELESLRCALDQVNKLKGRGDQAVAIEQVQCFALGCRLPLEEFLAKIQKYEKSLGLGKSVGKIKDTAWKFQYAFRKKDEANKLRTSLNRHIGTISMLLVLHGLEALDIASEQTDKNQGELRSLIEGSSRELRVVRGNVEAQALTISESTSTLRKLFWMLRSDVAAPLKLLSQTMARLCLSTQQCCAVMLELRANVPSIDTRFTYFQAPVRVEDALGRVFHFSSECSIEALYTEIKVRFKEGPGKTEVMVGDFEIFDARNSDQVFTISGRNVLLPGMSISMAIILAKKLPEGDICPMPHCASQSFIEAVGGGRTCSKCNVWFDEPSRKRNRDVDREWLVGRIRDKVKRAKTLHPNLQEASGIPSDEELKEAERSEIAAFKRIRFDTRLPTFKMNRDQILYSHVQPSKLLEEEEMRKFYLQMNKHLESLRHEMPQQFLSSSLFTRDAPRG